MMHHKLAEEKACFIPGPCGNLEALVQTPKNAFHQIGIICHPHPLYGGTMHNKVVHTLVKTLQELGLATVRFNFRGVGKSEGSYAAGEGEADDLHAVLKWAHQEHPNCAIWLGGFSFGSYIALKVAPASGCQKLVLVAPPIENFPLKTLPLPNCPVIIVQGDADEIVSSEMVFDWANDLPPQAILIRMNGATHFFHGKLSELKLNLLEELKPKS